MYLPLQSFWVGTAFLHKQKLQSQIDSYKVHLYKSLYSIGMILFSFFAGSSKWSMSPKQQICQVQLFH